ncbi:hypothetical protein ACGFWD_39590 [Streptomyces sp. NPDC048448]|uniref:hypothetical protein n=1 Tax=Streptomyces sp. NPDC048448 TaxID=3365554 RepID=UPI00371ACB31
MASRPTLDDVQASARAMLVMAARDATGEEMAAVLVRLGGGTREGQAHVNLLLAEVFAGILDDECPVIWRNTEGVPDVRALAEIAHDPGEAHRYVALKVADGQELSLADAKARIARRSSATDLAMLYLRYRHLHSEQLAAFIDDARKQTPLMVDHVWGVLWVACATVRAMAAYRAAAEAID